ncbi:MAG: NAD-dependent epimerase/dehydratase family protein [Cyanobacteriota bacterium]|nr:NAD-dependent epimerase/dehydratase family protein [Cyanobacteriota bacterium]
MKAFVTGANGFTGSHLVKALLEGGHSVTGLVRPSSNLSRLANCDVKLVYGDVSDRSILKGAIADADRVFHLAAYVELGLVDEGKMERANVEGTKAVMETARDAGVSKVVYCSTIGVFGDTQGKVIDETFQRTQKDFSSAYDRTKYQAQEIVDRFAAEGLPVVSLMPSGIFGKGDPHFGPIFDLFRQGKLKLWVGGDRVTGIVLVDDLVTAMLLAAEKGKPGEHYIISTGELTTREMFALLSRETGIAEPAEVPEALVRVAGNILDVAGRLFSWNPPLSRERVHYLYDRCVRIDAGKARRELGWQPLSVEETLREIIRTGETPVSDV